MNVHMKHQTEVESPPLFKDDITIVFALVTKCLQLLRLLHNKIVKQQIQILAHNIPLLLHKAAAAANKHHVGSKCIEFISLCDQDVWIRDSTIICVFSF